MEQTSQRAIRAMDPAGDLAEIMARLAAALSGDGAALSIGAISVKSVSPEISLVVPTSGSTGHPREVGLSTRALISSARDSNKFLGAEKGDLWSLLLPLTHIAGINVLIRSLECKTVPIDVRQISGKYPAVDFTAIVPTQLFRALNGDAELLEHLMTAKSVLVGGAALDTNLRKKATNAGINIVESYGMTETCGGCVFDGIALDGISIKLNSSGNIGISGSSLASQYINDVKLWNEKFQDGFFESSDVGEIIAGKLVISGRSDDIIISGGENISLKEIEKVVTDKYPELEIAAFAVPDSEWGQILYLAIVKTDGLEIKDDLGINSLLTTQISEIAKIKRFLYLEQLPRTPLDKIDRNELIKIAQKGLL